MAVQAKPTVLNADQQALVSFWAVKTVFLLELAFRGKYPRRGVGGVYLASAAEMRWLREEETPPDSMVWLACWDCEREVPVRYEPSGVQLPNVSWPAAAFRRKDWRRLVTWDEARRPSG